jgi:hypothetical protein
MSEQDNSGAGLESTDEAVAAFGRALNPTVEPAAVEAETDQEPNEEVEEQEQSEEEAEETGEAKVTIEVDGKTVELTPEQIAEVYKNGLRQADYTRKTMETAEQRKVADAEIAKATQERQEYQQKLQAYSAQIEGALNEQSQINWQDLIDNDPVEYLKQQHLYNQRQAALMQARNEQSRLAQVQQEYEVQAYQEYLKAQEQQLVENLPAWKDKEKASAEKAEIRKFMLEQGFNDQEISQVADFRHVLLLRDAMQFRKLLKEAPGATKKVTQAPTKVERAGVATNSQDNRNREVVKRALKSGKDSDIVAAFGSIL